MSKTNNEATKPAAKPQLFKVKLLKPHTHAGESKQADDSIDVTAPERDFLIGVGVIESPNTTDGAAPAAE
ncbi:DUF7210 family protein [Stutzerimonas nitrititolerans]|uniref:DUF7210 family protein n=1 Tax=Stutzerimonas nitrititolerans TaxID=2482751 RepID=UPI0028A017F7|nr:hypothetical protein [Stutzerimonas nitrititolerans]